MKNLKIAIMKKNRLFFMFAALFVAAAVMFSCQKEEVLNADVQLKSEVIALGGHLDCEEYCIDENSGDMYKSTASDDAPALDVTITYYNTPTHMVYVFSGVSDACVKLGSEIGTDITLLIVDGKYMVPLAVDWDGCDEVNQDFWISKNCSGGEGNTSTIETSYKLIPVCPPGPPVDCTEWMTESSFAGSVIVNAKPWFYYYTGGAQTLWGGQTINVGGVNMVGDDLVIQLTGGWQLQPGEETVKVYGYVDMPTYRPNPSGRNSEYAEMIYHGTDLTIQILETYAYYVIHVDVRKCMDE